MTSTRSRLSVAARREQLLAIGAAAFGDHPYEQVSIEDIAERAGVSRGLMYHYFATKRDFLAAVVRQEAVRLAEVTALAYELPLAQRIPAAIDAYLDYVQNHAAGYRALHRGGEGVDEQIRQIVWASIDEQVARIVAAVDADPIAEPLLVLGVRGWIGFVIAVSLEWLDHPTCSREELRDLMAVTLVAVVGHHKS